MNTKMIFKRGPLELWRSDYGRYSRPSFMIMGEDGLINDFPSFDNPDNGGDALRRFKELRAELGV